MNIHPRPNHHGTRVDIRHPSEATPLAAWSDPAALAAILPDGPMPAGLNGIPFLSGTPTTTPAGIPEPAFVAPAGKKAAAGCIIEEADGRVWIVAPTNAFAGYSTTFPKGTVDPGGTLQATAIRETFEESGLHVALVRHLCDLARSRSYTRYYLARRTAGNPADMGWESQAVALVPRARLREMIGHPNDAPILDALGV